MPAPLATVLKETARIGAELHAAVERQALCALMSGLSARDEFYLCPSGEGHGTSCSTPLYAHQKYGVRWLQALYRSGMRGGILADEMGLGKTVQIIAFFAALAREGSLGTYLIVAPLSTLQNWSHELSKWAPWLHVEMFHGDHAARTKLRHRIRLRHRRAFREQDTLRQHWALGVPPMTLAKALGGVVLASYEMVLADQGALARLLHWDITVVDEAQRLKRFDCRLLRMLNKATCGLRLILTGTPVQNNVTELWTLLAYIAPDRFGKNSQAELLTQADQSAESVLQEGRLGTTPADEHHHDTTLLAALQQALQSFMLRRTKDAVGIELPPKLDVILSAPLTDTQRVYYERVQSLGKYSSGRLMHARKCCIHPFLFSEFEHEAGTFEGVSNKAATPNIFSSTPEECALASFLAYSGKFQLLDRLLSGLRGDVMNKASSDLTPVPPTRRHRVLLFSQMTKALDLVEHYLFLKERAIASRRPDWRADALINTPRFSYARLDGGSSAETRLTSIAAFQRTSARISSTDALSDDGDAWRTNEEGEREELVSRAPSRKRRVVDRAVIGQYIEEGVAEDDCVFDDGSSLTLRPAQPQKARPPCSVRTPFTERHTNQLQTGKKPLNPPMPYTLLGCQRGLPCVSAILPPHSQPTQNHSISLPLPSAAPSPLPVREAERPDDNDDNDDDDDVSPFLFLISTRTGGAGLNLTAADTVIMLDGDFNPQNDQQAVDRCHRIGQTSPVVVYRLVTPETVEQAQLATVTRKLRLENQLLTDPAVPATVKKAALSGRKRIREEPQVENKCLRNVYDKPLFVSCVAAGGAGHGGRVQEKGALAGALHFEPLMRAAEAPIPEEVLVDNVPLPDSALARLLDRDLLLRDVAASVGCRE